MKYLKRFNESKEIDDILDKINDQGINSLTDEEKKIMGIKPKNKYVDAIGGMLGDLVTPEQAQGLMSNLYSKSVKGYTKGDVMTIAEMKQIVIGDIVHMKIWDEDGKVRENDFKLIKYVNNNTIGSDDGFELPIESFYKDTDLIDHMEESCGWRFTLRKAIKK